MIKNMRWNDQFYNEVDFGANALVVWSSPVDILDDMLAGVGWTMQDYLKHGENDYYPPLPNGHRLFLHDIRRVAVRAAVAMGEEGDVVVSSLDHICFFIFTLLLKKKIQMIMKAHVS